MGQVAELIDGQLQLAVGLIDQACEARPRRPGGLGGDQAEREGQADEPLLSSVMQVPLQPSPLGVAGRDDPGLCGPQVFELGQHLGVKPLVLQGKPGSGGDLPGQAGVV